MDFTCLCSCKETYYDGSAVCWLMGREMNESQETFGRQRWKSTIVNNEISTKDKGKVLTWLFQWHLIFNILPSGLLSWTYKKVLFCFSIREIFCEVHQHFFPPQLSLNCDLITFTNISDSQNVTICKTAVFKMVYGCEFAVLIIRYLFNGIKPIYLFHYYSINNSVIGRH